MKLKSKLRSSTNYFNPFGVGKIGRMGANESRLGRYLREGEHTNFEFPDEVDDIAAVPERARVLYVKDEASGKFKMDDIGSLRSTVGNVKGENKSLKGKLSQFHSIESLGLSVEEIQQLKKDKEEAAERKAKEEGDWNSLKEQLETNFTKTVQEKEGRIGKLESHLKKVVRDDRAREAMADKDVQGNPLFLLPLINDRVEVTETDDGFDLVVKRSDGTPMLNAENKPATMKDLLLEFKSKPEYAGAFNGLNQSGGGAPANGGQGGGAPTGVKRSTMSPREKAEYIRAHGLEVYNKLPN